jgi:hypothetical protein
MKFVLSIIGALILAASSWPAPRQDKDKPQPALVKISGSFDSLAVAWNKKGENGKVTEEAVSLLVTGLADDVKVNVHAPRLIGGDELTNLVKGGLDNGVVAEGTLKADGKTLVLAARVVRVRDDGKDKDLAKGTAIVEGEVVKGKFKYGKDEESEPVNKLPFPQ